jgi:hypothetical protein
MLCFQHAKLGEICTNRCHERLTCTRKKVKFLIYGMEDLFFKSESEISNGKYGVSYQPYCSTTDIRLHWIIDDGVTYISDIKTDISCANPYCSNHITVPQECKIEWEVTDYKKYGKKFRPCCSKECQERLEALQAESKFYMAGTLKNHDKAQWLKGIDNIKRFKIEDVFIITGNDTEVRAKLLYCYLSFIKDTEKKLKSTQVKKFLSDDLPDELSIKESGANQYTSRVIQKCKQLFPDSILIDHENEKEMNIQIINQLI